MKQGSLSGKAVVVTGAGRGIGRGIALLLGREGARVVVNDPGVAMDGKGHSQAEADGVVVEIGEAGGEAVANYDSVATMDGGQRAVETAIEAFGRLDGVVTCAGILRDRMIYNTTEEEWDAVIAVHLKGTFSVVKRACQIFREQRSGRIITITSTSGLYGASGQANYAAAKDGIAGFTRVVARDMARYGVSANSICPSALTRMTAGLEEIRQKRQQMGIQGSGLLGESQPPVPEGVAPAVAWLLSDEAASVTGQVIYIGGGLAGPMGHPVVTRRITKTTGPWTVEELAQVFPRTLGMDLVNPAPPISTG